MDTSENFISEIKTPRSPPTTAFYTQFYSLMIAANTFIC